MKYPLPRSKPAQTNTPSGLANRGMNFESMINTSNEVYREQKRAIIYKKPTPIHIVHIKNQGLESYIDKAYFEQPSTTDYNGVYRGKYIDFEAKETKNKTSFPLANIHAHQLEHLRRITDHGGIGFILIYFSQLTAVYLVDAKLLLDYAATDLRKSLPLDWIKEKGVLVPLSYVIPVTYLDVVDQVYF